MALIFNHPYVFKSVFSFCMLLLFITINCSPSRISSSHDSIEQDHEDFYEDDGTGDDNGDSDSRADSYSHNSDNTNDSDDSYPNGDSGDDGSPQDGDDNGDSDGTSETIDCTTDFIGTEPIQWVSALHQYGITWHFANCYKVGKFANGDFWVVGPITITSIAPACDTLHHGWEVNPDDSLHQGFDNRIQDFDSTKIPTLPFTTSGTMSIIKTISYDPSDTDCRDADNEQGCLITASILTVLEQEPDQAGIHYFRPPYFGTQKPLIDTATINTSVLPQLDSTDITNKITPMDMYTLFSHAQLDHLTDTRNMQLHPRLHMPAYGAALASHYANGALSLLMDEPYTEKEALLIAYIQAGIDLYHMGLNGTTWPANGGFGNGRKIVIAFAAYLLDHEGMSDFLGVADTRQFGEHGHIYLGENAGIPLYGQACSDDYQYWRYMLAGDGAKDCRDPYGYIDGGYLPGSSYHLCCTSHQWKASATVLKLMPGLQPIYGFPLLIEYAERWVTTGTHTQPDPCAPAEGTCIGGSNNGYPCYYANTDMCPDGTCTIDSTLYGITYGPDTNGDCITDMDSTDGFGRFPQRHSIEIDGGAYRSLFADDLWNKFLN